MLARTKHMITECTGRLACHWMYNQKTRVPLDVQWDRDRRRGRSCDREAKSPDRHLEGGYSRQEMIRYPQYYGMC